MQLYAVIFLIMLTCVLIFSIAR